jgi:hypothetical protein
VDLETGFTISSDWIQRKGGGAGKYNDEQTENKNFRNGSARAFRSAVFDFVPDSIVRVAIDHAKKTLVNKFGKTKKTLREGIEACLGIYFAEYSVNQQSLEKRIGRPISAWGPEDLVALKSILDTIRAGETTVEQEFDMTLQNGDTHGNV